MNRIDVGAVLASRAPGLASRLPGFAVNWLRKLVKEEQLNEVLKDVRHHQGLDFVDAVIERLGIDLQVEGQANVPAEERIVAVANHPLGGLDGLALMSVLGKKHKDPVFLVNDLLMNVSQLQTLFLPVDKHGSNRKYQRLHRQAFASDRALLHFPAGLCSRRQSGQIQDLPWHKSFVTIARRYKRSILPIYIHGANSKSFYRLASLRERLGIGFNFEMLLLPGEMLKWRDSVLRVRVGEVIPWESLDESASAEEWARRVRASTYALGESVAGNVG